MDAETRETTYLPLPAQSSALSVNSCVHGCSATDACFLASVSPEEPSSRQSSASPRSRASSIEENNSTDSETSPPPFPESIGNPDRYDVWQDEMVGYQQRVMERSIVEVRDKVFWRPPELINVPEPRIILDCNRASHRENSRTRKPASVGA